MVRFSQLGSKSIVHIKSIASDGVHSGARACSSIEQQVMFSALARKPEAASEFFGALSGSVPLQEFFSSANVFRIIGPSGMGRVLFGKLTAARRPTSVIRQ